MPAKTAATHPIRRLIDHLERANVAVEHTIDPQRPERIVYGISGGSREAVQAKIDELTNKVADGFGYATFDGPYRNCMGWSAIGQVVVYDAADVAP